MRYTISEMAALLGVTTHTLRYYEKMGLIQPEVNRETGYRYYDINQNARLDMIAYMKELGMGNDRYRLLDIDADDKEISVKDAVKDVKPFHAE